MMVKKRGLGRGLDALLAGVNAPVSAVEPMAAVPKHDELKELPVEVIQRGRYQPRVDMHPEGLEDLARSIRSQGVVQPIVVRRISGERYEIIAGERRWRAAQMAGLEFIPAVVRDVSDDAALAMALIENIQREGLNPLEEAHALHRLITEFNMTHQQAAEAVGRSRAAVSNLLRLLDLNEDVKKLISHGDLEMGHARALLGLQGALQSEVARKVVAKSLSVRETEQLVKRLQQGRVTTKTASAVDADTRQFEQDLSERLGATVKIQCTSKGKGKLTIFYNSLDELEGIVSHIQ